MSGRVEDFSASLRLPEEFREVCGLLSSVSRSCTLATDKLLEDQGSQPQFSQSVDGEDLLRLIAVGLQNTMQLWIHLSADSFFSNFNVRQPERMELKADSLAHAFQNISGLLSMTDVRMQISHRAQRQPSTMDAASQVIPQSQRLISFQMDNRASDGLATKAVEQKIYAQIVDYEAYLAEPFLNGIGMWVDLKESQLREITKVCDQYRQMNELIRITVSRSGLLTLVSRAPEAEATTTWRVAMAEKGLSDDEAEEDLFVSDARGDSETASSDRNEVACTVLARDWYTCLQVRRTSQRVIVGVQHEGGVVLHGYFKQGKGSESGVDVASYYLWHQAR